jgi:hypothetical protein
MTDTTLNPLEELIEAVITDNPDKDDAWVQETVKKLLAESAEAPEETEVEVENEDEILLTELVGTALEDKVDDFTVKFDLGMQAILAGMLDAQKAKMQAEMFGIETPEEENDPDIMEMFAEYLDANEYQDVVEAVEAFATELEMDDDTKKLFAAEVKKVMDESELPAIPSGVIVQGTTAKERATLNSGGGKRSVTPPDPIRKLGTSAEIEKRENKGEQRPNV